MRAVRRDSAVAPRPRTMKGMVFGGARSMTPAQRGACRAGWALFGAGVFVLATLPLSAGPASADVGRCFATGGTRVLSGGFVTHTFSVGGPSTFTTYGTAITGAAILVVGGGGAGGGGAATGGVSVGAGGGGGGGGVLSLTGQTLTANSVYQITVGAGGTPVVGQAGGNGGASTIARTTGGAQNTYGAPGGSGGGLGGGSTTSGTTNRNGTAGVAGGSIPSFTSPVAASGSSGGGGAGRAGTVGSAGGAGAAGTSGSAGGAGRAGGTALGGGGGGGALPATAGTFTNDGRGGAGAAGRVVTLATSVTYGAGGGGGAITGRAAGAGGTGGGGAGGVATANGSSGSSASGTAGNGGGGGGSAATATAGGAGSNGTVVIRYPSNLQCGSTAPVSNTITAPNFTWSLVASGLPSGVTVSSYTVVYSTNPAVLSIGGQGRFAVYARGLPNTTTSINIAATSSANCGTLNSGISGFGTTWLCPMTDGQLTGTVYFAVNARLSNGGVTRYSTVRSVTLP